MRAEVQKMEECLNNVSALERNTRKEMEATRVDKEALLEQLEESEKRNKDICLRNERLRMLLEKSEASCERHVRRAAALEDTLSELKVEIENLRNNVQVGADETRREQMHCNIQVEMRTTIERRRTILTEIQEIRGNVRVFCRIRPPRQDAKPSDFMTVPEATTGNNWWLSCNGKEYSFDRLFQTDSTNSEIYGETANVVDLVLEGSNVCILAYGQTGTGKTFTMDGTQSDPGVNKRALRHLFDAIDERDDVSFQVSISAMEIYNDEIYDLLEKRASNKQAKRLQLRGGHGNDDMVQVPGLRKTSVTTFDEAARFMEFVKRRRSTSATAMNSSSSRSHCVIEVGVKSGAFPAFLHLVDLAGSERVRRSEVTGQRLKEAGFINKSLAALGNVFAALKQRRRQVPYRDSKLTHLLKNSIGGRAKTLMFVTVSGDAADRSETNATLEFGKRVSGIVLNENISEQKMQRLRELEREMGDADRKIVSLRKEIC